MALLEIKGFKKKFENLEVLKGIDFELEKGETLAIIGSSGSGKTTLLRCLNFLESPDEGKMYLKGELLFDSADRQRASEAAIRKKRLHFGLVFQNFNLFSKKTALQNVMEGLSVVKKMKKEEAERIAREQLKNVGLLDHANHYPRHMSGGQQQRVAIARALAAAPAIILADEPTGNLDGKTSQDVLSLLKVTSRKFAQTIVMITHNEEIAQLADRIIRIEDGRIIK